MSASPAPYYGTPQPYLDAIRDAMWSAGVYCQQAQQYADLGDLAGLAYSIRCLTALNRMAVSTMGDLREMADREPRQPVRTEKVFTTVEHGQ